MEYTEKEELSGKNYYLYKDKNPLYTSRTPSIPIEMNKLQLSCCFVILKV